MTWIYDYLMDSVCRRIRDIIVQNKGSLVLELQQRSIEFNSIVEKHQNIRYEDKIFWYFALLILRCLPEF